MGLTVVRLGYGVLLLLAPRQMYRFYAGRPADSEGSAVARILGLRQAVQAACLIRSGTPKSLLLGAGVDALHAASMLGVARLNPERARPATIDAVGAASFSIAGIVTALRRASVGP
jgi:hypothetical protein